MSMTDEAGGEIAQRANQEEEQVDKALKSLDGFVSRAQAQNSRHQAANSETLDRLISNASHGKEARNRLRMARSVSMETKHEVLRGHLALKEGTKAVLGSLRRPLGDICSTAKNVVMNDYKPTGETPRRPMGSEMPVNLPKTAPRDRLLARSLTPPSPSKISTPIGGRKRLREADSQFCSPPAPARDPSSPPVPAIPAQYADLVPPPSKRRASGVLPARPTGLPAPAKSGRRRHGDV